MIAKTFEPILSTWRYLFSFIAGFNKTDLIALVFQGPDYIVPKLFVQSKIL